MSSIREIRAEETYPLRKEELRRNVTLSHEMQGDHDSDTLHLGLFEKGELVSIASFMKASLPDFEGRQYQLRGMATAEAYQGKGFGRKLLREAEKRLRNAGADLLWCNAREVALDFYRKLGYEVLGPSFEVPEIGTHYRMFKRFDGEDQA